MDKELEVENFLTDDSKNENFVSEYYDKWSANYEQDLENFEGGFHAHEPLVTSLLPFLENVDRSIKIIDIGSGTGLLGKEICKHGFENIDALDGSSAMLNEAKSKKIYKNYFHEIIGVENIVSIKDETYDCLITSATFLPKHLTTKHLPVLLRIVKKGGILGISMRLEFLSTCPELSDMEMTLDHMEKKNEIKILKTERFENFFMTKPGKIFIFQRL